MGAVQYKIFSVDDHIIEPPDVWTSRVPRRYLDVAPRVLIERDGSECWLYEDQRAAHMGLNTVPGHPREEWRDAPITFKQIAPACYDPQERVIDLLSQGVLSSVGFPNFPRFGGMLFNDFKDKELASYCVRAWNDFVLEEWCPAGPKGFFVPMVICQMWDVDAAVAEVKRCASLGARTVSFVENPTPAGLPSFHSDYWDPLWAFAEEADMPMCLHIASSGFVPIPDPAVAKMGQIVVASVCGMLTVTNLLLSKICDKFPRIKFVLSEAGVGWIPAILERADRQVTRHEWWDGPNSLLPSEKFRRNVFACMVDEPIGIQQYEAIGVDNIVAEIDYPHADTPYPHTQLEYARTFEGMPAEVVEKVTYRNAERCFSWTMADESLLNTREVVAWREALGADPYATLNRPRSRSFHDVEGRVLV